MRSLAELNTQPYRKGEPPLSDIEISELQSLIPAWDVIDVDGIKRLERVFKFKNFVQAIAFTNKVGELAEEQDHHPALLTEWGRVKVTWWTHFVKGLHRNDFIMAAKTDQIVES
ncbi:MAG: 4a-hydroxytetrahydrobiopterin dehydratase [Anaerolineales bacterium]|nr:4a-hydroxytetrahydrobiopterin dehydratase [Chloroflexota bacterium]MBL6982678.1 4a-hydroxytetrahydrobiopterin dehydratase [Anaerolineales bacterium]